MRTDREKQGLRRLVKSVLVETAQFEEQGGQITEKRWFTYSSTQDIALDGLRSFELKDDRPAPTE